MVKKNERIYMRRRFIVNESTGTIEEHLTDNDGFLREFKAPYNRKSNTSYETYETYLQANNKQIDLTRSKIMKIKKEARNILFMFVLFIVIFIASIYGLL